MCQTRRPGVVWKVSYQSLPHKPLAQAQTYKTPSERAQFLKTTEIFANIHAALATSGQTAVPDNSDTSLHFNCFVQAPKASAREAKVATDARRVIELDGRRIC